MGGPVLRGPDGPASGKTYPQSLQAHRSDGNGDSAASVASRAFSLCIWLGQASAHQPPQPTQPQAGYALGGDCGSSGEFSFGGVGGTGPKMLGSYGSCARDGGGEVSDPHQPGLRDIQSGSDPTAGWLPRLNGDASTAMGPEDAWPGAMGDSAGRLAVGFRLYEQDPLAHRRILVQGTGVLNDTPNPCAS